jgi:lysophospholipid acyltransferase
MPECFWGKLSFFFVFFFSTQHSLVVLFVSNGVETLRFLCSNWNIQTALWLRRSIYVRISPEYRPTMTPEEKKQAKTAQGTATLLTFVVSAFWHGFYPGYYGTFVTLSLLNSCGRIGRRYLRPLFHRPSKLAKYVNLYHFLGWFTLIITVNYAAQAFQLYTLDKIYIAWSRVWFLGHILAGSMILGEWVGLFKIVKGLGRKWFGADYGERSAQFVELSARTEEDGAGSGKKGDEKVLKKEE